MGINVLSIDVESGYDEAHYAKQPDKARLQHTDRTWKLIYCRIHHPPKSYRSQNNGSSFATFQKKFEKLPQNIVADAGYRSEKNYEYLEENAHGNYVKYNRFHWEINTKPE